MKSERDKETTNPVTLYILENVFLEINKSFLIIIFCFSASLQNMFVLSLQDLQECSERPVGHSKQDEPHRLRPLAVQQ